MLFRSLSASYCFPVTILDVSKNGNTGTLLPTWPTNCPVYIDGKNNKMLKAFYFDGVNDYVNCGNASPLNIQGAITIMAWVKILAFSDHGRVTYKSLAYTMWLHTSFRFYVSLRFTDGWYDFFKTTGDLVANTWYHFAFTYDKTDHIGRLYLNGVYCGGRQKTGLVDYRIQISANPLYFGRAEAVQYQKQNLDCVCL